MGLATRPISRPRDLWSGMCVCWRGGLVLCGVGATYAVFLLDGQTVRRLTREDGLVETVGALCFLGASALFLMAYVCSGDRTLSIPGSVRRRSRNLFYLAFSLVFMFGFLEEISWGQRLLGIETPGVLARGNQQNEINFHNLEVFESTGAHGDRKSFLGMLLNMDRMFSLFWFSLCVCVPLLDRYIPKISSLLKKVRFPVVWVGFAGAFLGNYIISRVVVAQRPMLRHNVVELKESTFALLFLCAAAWVFHREIKSTGVAVEQRLAPSERI